jgi:hypothetical protein
MIDIIKPRQPETYTEYAIIFTDDELSGYSFPCDKDGNIKFASECAIKNYELALTQKERFTKAYNELETRVHNYTAPAIARCHCGAKIALENEYQGACECEKCGRWYNLFGQELIHPDGWEDDDYDY